MDWIIVALASAVAFAIVSVLDKTILNRYISHAPTFIVLTGLFQIPGAVAVFVVVPFEDYSAWPLTATYLSGLLWGAALVVLFLVMSKQEVSRVIPVFQTSPVFVAILAIIFLSEDLSALQWVAILVTVAGAASISLRRTGKSGRLRLGSPFFLLLLASGLAGGGQLLTKVGLEDMGLWNVFVMRAAGLSTATVLLPLRPTVLRGIRQVAKSPRCMGIVVLNEGFLAFLAVLLTVWSISLGPVSLVVTVQSTRPLFVFVLSVLLSSAVWRVLDEPLDRRTLVMKSASTVMIVGGISAISVL